MRFLFTLVRGLKQDGKFYIETEHDGIKEGGRKYIILS